MATNENLNDSVQVSATESTVTDPFDDPNADVILRSRDNVDFRTFKLMLSLASEFFKDMFSLSLCLLRHTVTRCVQGRATSHTYGGELKLEASATVLSPREGTRSRRIAGSPNISNEVPDGWSGEARP